MEEPKVWVVDHAWSSPSLIHSELFLTEGAARKRYDGLKGAGYRKMYRTTDVWNYTAKQRRNDNVQP